MRDLLLSIISSLTFSGALTAALIWLSRNWITERLRRAIEHEYAQKLESHKAQLKAEHEIALERLRSDLAREHAIETTATATFTAGHIAASERRLQAVEALWKTILELRNNTPTIVGVADMLTSDETRKVPADPRLAPLLKDLSEAKIVSIFIQGSSGVEVFRPFFGDYLWSLFFVYRALMGRISLIFVKGRGQATVDYWAEDDGVRQLLSAVLSKDELEHFHKMRIGKLDFMRGAMEAKILAEIRRIVSGQSSGEVALDQARRISEALARVEAANKGA